MFLHTSECWWTSECPWGWRLLELCLGSVRFSQAFKVLLREKEAFAHSWDHWSLVLLPVSHVCASVAWLGGIPWMTKTWNYIPEAPVLSVHLGIPSPSPCVWHRARQGRQRGNSVMLRDLEFSLNLLLWSQSLSLLGFQDSPLRGAPDNAALLIISITCNIPKGWV